MKNIISLSSLLKNVSLAVVAMYTLVACTAAQQVYDEDGIYSSSSTEETTQEPVATNGNSNTQYYKDYFSGATGDVFTDIDTYSSEGGDTGEDIYIDESSFDANTGYAGWGDEVADVEVNYYNNSAWGYGGFNNFGFGYGGFNNFGFGYGGFGYGGFGYGYSPYVSYFSPFFYGGFYSPFYGFGRNRFFGSRFYGNRFNRGGFGRFNNCLLYTSPSPRD